LALQSEDFQRRTGRQLCPTVYAGNVATLTDLDQVSDTDRRRRREGDEILGGPADLSVGCHSRPAPPAGGASTGCTDLAEQRRAVGAGTNTGVSGARTTGGRALGPARTDWAR